MWYNAFDNTKCIEQGIILIAIFFKRGPNLEAQAAHSHANHSKYPTSGVSTECARSFKTLRWDDLREGGDASKIIFLRVLSDHLSTTRFDRLSRFLKHNYGNSQPMLYIIYIVRDLWPVTRDLQPATCDLRIRPAALSLALVSISTLPLWLTF